VDNDERHPHFCECDTCINGAHGMRIDGFTPRVVKERGYRTRAPRKLPASETISATIPIEQRRALAAEALARGITLADVLREVVAGWFVGRGALGMAAE
jgi:hypothetical protein